MYRVLMAFLLGLIAIILGGTLYALIFRPSPKPAEPAREGLAVREDRVFTGLGRIRTSTADSRTVVLSVAFPYDPEDRTFSEELALRVGELRRITADYFTAYSAEELGGRPESEIKAELLNRYNALLRLGAVKVLYFNDFMIIK